MDREVYAEAAEYLSEHGLYKGAVRGPNGSRCAIGALGEGLRARGHYDTVPFSYYVTPVERHLEQAHGVWLGDAARENGYLRPLAQWSDDPKTSAEDVILLFKEMAHGEGE